MANVWTPKPPMPSAAAVATLDCGCRMYCPSHDREYIELHEDDGQPYCSECAADGWSAELCTPSAGQCWTSGNADKANEWERGFMCPTHAAEHVAFCAEAVQSDGGGTR